MGLAFFIPLLMGTGGNAGSQMAALMIRSLATGEVVPRDFLRLLKREILMGFILGCCLAIVGSGNDPHDCYGEFCRFFITPSL